MSVDLIRYDLLVQDALRGVVRRVLTDVGRDGLPGDHHLYVSFDTQAPGVRLSPRLKERYPEEMTIVLQHQFWDLLVTEQFFEVGLSFNGIPERLHIPFAALKGFFDPSVKFGLQFEPMAEEDEEGEEDSPAPAPLAEVTPITEARPTSVPSTRTPTRPAVVPDKPEAAKTEAGKPEGRKSGEARTGGKAETRTGSKPVPAASRTEVKPAPRTDSKADKPADKPGPKAVDDEGKDGAADGVSGGARVVRLDTFRKK